VPGAGGGAGGRGEVMIVQRESMSRTVNFYCAGVWGGRMVGKCVFTCVCVCMGVCGYE